MAVPKSVPAALRSAASRLASRNYSSGVLDSLGQTFDLIVPEDAERRASTWSSELEGRYQSLGVRRWPGWRVQAYNEVLYSLVRTVRPSVLVETGVEHGLTSAYILGALNDNHSGTLHSIELVAPGGWQQPPSDSGMPAPADVSRIGSVIPAELRNRWQLHLGPAQEQLPRLLHDLGTIDLFFHDSDHSEPHMLWEYRTAWEHLPTGGWLVSDDIDFNHAFDRFRSGISGVAWKWIGSRPRHGLIRKGPAVAPPSSEVVGQSP
jgi:predicted O-methyltransferase YrrM